MTFTNKNCVEELCKKSFENKLCGIPHTQKKILQIKLLPLSAAKQFTLRSILHIKFCTLRKQSFHCH